MKTKIYTISYTSYCEYDNYLYNETKVTDNGAEAIEVYEGWRNNAKAVASGDEGEFEIQQVEISYPNGSRRYRAKRAVGTEDGYQVIIELCVTEI
jgi:hypothetical protein